MMMRDVLGYFAYKYNGDGAKILEAIERKEPVTKEQIQSMYKKLDYDFFTVVDENYPEMLKLVNNPPIVMFYKGDIGLINEDNDIIAKQTYGGIRILHAYDANITSKGIEMNCVMACECHDDMDMLIEHMEHAQDNLPKLLSLARDRFPKNKNIER